MTTRVVDDLISRSIQRGVAAHLELAVIKILGGQ